jgi:hypothetical protein
MEISTFGFLGTRCFEDEDGVATRGAVLVTSIDTKPLEFRITAPVRPKGFQVIIYGELLDEHIAVELIGLPLLSALENKPDLILVRDHLLLGISSKQEIPTIRIMRADEPLMKKGFEIQPLNSPDSSYPPVKAYTSEKFAKNLKIVAEQLQVIFLQRDPMEPFERIDRACVDVHGRKLGEK